MNKQNFHSLAPLKVPSGNEIDTSFLLVRFSNVKTDVTPFTVSLMVSPDFQISVELQAPRD